MAIFARRVLQQCINESLAYATKRNRHVWVSKLNSSSDPAYAATEWEIILLHTTAKFGKLRHEPLLPGGTTLLDIVFDGPNISFGADITAVSDLGLHKKNPIRELEKRLRELYTEARISSGGIAVNVTDFSASRGTNRGSIVPPVDEFATVVFNDAFCQWIADINASPSDQSSYQVVYRNPGSVIAFTYLPGRRGVWCGGHTDYRVTKSRDNNPLYKALTSKASKLKRSGFSGSAGIVVCDGGSDSLRENFSGNITPAEVVFEFLRRHTSVAFVVILSLRNIDSSTIRQCVLSRIYVEKEEPWHGELGKLFSQIAEALPQVMQNAENATNELKFWEGKKRVNLGRLSMIVERMGIRELRMSTRTLLDVLAGRLSQTRLNEHYRHGNRKGLFEHLANSGSLIESARVERKPNEDDDEIIFTFGPPDPAASAFKVPDEG